MQAHSTHRALVLAGPNQIRIENVPTERPQAGEVLVSPQLVGICGTDQDMHRGNRPAGTSILGHEEVTEVVAVGSAISAFSVGSPSSCQAISWVTGTQGSLSNSC